MATTSIMVITLDRFEVSSKTIRQNLQNCGTEMFELLCADNGSKDKRIVEYIRVNPDLHLAYYRLNSANEGCGRAFNQLFFRSSGEYLCLMGNDIAMPDHWLEVAIAYLKAIPNAGLVGFDWGHSCLPPLSRKFGIDAHWLTPQLNRVFGTMVFKRRVIEEVGFFHEGYGPYGIEDSDFSERVNVAGFNSCYVRDMKSVHLVNDVGEDTPYRKMKDESLSNNLTIFSQRAVKWKTEAIREPLPHKRDPI